MGRGPEAGWAEQGGPAGLGLLPELDGVVELKAVAASVWVQGLDWGPELSWVSVTDCVLQPGGISEPGCDPEPS